MRSTSLLALVRCILVVAVPATGFCQNPESPGSSHSVKKILYTAQLNGFLGSWGLCQNLPSKCLDVVKKNADGVQEFKKDSGSILVGMGDNFGPDALWGSSDPTNEYSTDAIISERSGADTSKSLAIHFMHKAGYDAVVPGKLDFAFGLGFLSAAATSDLPLIANNLTIRAVPSPECLSYPSVTTGLPILPNQAATPVGTASGGGSGGAGGAGTCSSTPDPPRAGSALTLVWPDANAIYPWTTAVAISVPDGEYVPDAGALVCPASVKVSSITSHSVDCVLWDRASAYEGTNLRMLETQAKLAQPRVATTTRSTIRFALGGDHPGPSAAAYIPVSSDGKISARSAGNPAGMLFAGTSVRVCLKKTPKKGQDPTKEEYGCISGKPLTVQRLFISRAWIQVGNGNEDVVFGALAPDSLNGLSPVDRQWVPKNPDKDPMMQVGVGDPAEALTQAVNAYNIVNKKTPATGILLAQMTPAEAKSLADSLGTSAADGNLTQVRMIVSAADEVEASPEWEVKFPPAPQPENPAAAQRSPRFIPVITPAPVFQTKNCLGEVTDSDPEPAAQLCLARLVYRDDRTLINAPALALSEGPKDHTHRLPPPNDQGAPSAENTYCDNAISDTWECKVLDGMREAMKDHSGAKPDIAILEEKQFDYLRSGINPDSPVQPGASQVAKALWKAGNLTRVTLKGSTILSILNQSQANQARSFQTMQSLRRSEQLRIRGIYMDKDNIYVRGIPLDANKLYAVATTDQLANASSDYPAFANTDLTLPEYFWRHKESTYVIADIAMMPAHESPSVKPRSATDLMIAFRDTPLGIDGNAALPQVASLAETHSNRTLFSETATPTPSRGGKRAQGEPLMHVILQQDSVGFSFSRPSQSDQNIGANLGGVTNPNVVAAHSDNFSAVSDARVEFYLKRRRCIFCLSDVGADSQFNLTHNVQGSTTASPALTTTTGAPIPKSSSTFPANLYVLSPFLDFQTNRFGVWKPMVVRPGVFSVNIASLTTYSASAPPAGSTTSTTDFVLHQKRTETVGVNLGTRFEWSDLNYLEFGYSYQKDHDVLAAVSAPGSGPCTLTNEITLATCTGTFAPNGALKASYATYTQDIGGYTLYDITRPIFKGPSAFPYHWPAKTLLLYQGSGYGNLFAFRREAASSTLTRYAFAINNNLQVSLPANLSFGPSYSLFFFQANAHGIGSTLHRHSLSAQLNYSFDWHGGLSRTKALAGQIQ